MYIVRFIRKDKNPDEIYYYHTLKEAEYHFNLFVDDDSNLYEKIEIRDTEENFIKSIVYLDDSIRI